jgi:hypothetical protein
MIVLSRCVGNGQVQAPSMLLRRGFHRQGEGPFLRVDHIRALGSPWKVDEMFRTL